MGEGYKAKGPRLRTGRYRTTGGGRTSGGSRRTGRPARVGRPLILLGIGGTEFPVSVGRPVPGICRTSCVVGRPAAVEGRTSGGFRSSGRSRLCSSFFFRLLFQASLADGVGVPWCLHSSSSSVKFRQYLCMHTRGCQVVYHPRRGQVSTCKGDDSPLCM